MALKQRLALRDYAITMDGEYDEEFIALLD